MERRDQLVEDVREDITSILEKRYSPSKLFGSVVEVKPTKEISYKANIPIDRTFILKKSNGWIIYLVIISVAVSAIVISLSKRVLIPAIVLPLSFVLIALFQNTEITPNIRLDETGISYNNITIAWNDIFQTFIIKQPFGQSYQTFLWIAKTDKTYASVNISSPSYVNIGHYIEQYRKVYISANKHI